ncbi:response regulator transcription factor [Calidifontibacillus oryziterrae]|uniref:response regulator transcription factor n=1 Tax=Calidifontibacillus oryziterrae TaxID=1191699 RepID=UPI00031C20B2|nr:response regulator transcription factor [Calidifontibacillus oryziterrae]
MPESILVVEDDHKIMRFIRANLIASNYTVFSAHDGVEALNLYEKHLPDLILMDLMLPKLTGLQCVEKIRQYSNVPIIILTAKGSSQDVIQGLELGADDYIVKPFDINELIARIKAVLRRSNSEVTVVEPTINIGSLYIHLNNYKVLFNNEKISLTPTEFNLLVELAKNPECVLTHEHLLSHIWGQDYINETHYLRVCIARLRKKIPINEDEKGFIQTIPTVGYKMIG